MASTSPGHDDKFVCALPGGVRPGLRLPLRCDPAGHNGPTPGQSRGPRWRRTSRGFFLPADQGLPTPEQRILEASFALPYYGSVSGWSALRWAGGAWFDGLLVDGTERPVQLHTPGRAMRPQPGFVVSEERSSFVRRRVVDGVTIACPTFATAFEMRYAANEREAGVIFEMAAYNDLVSTTELAAHLEELNGWTGVPKIRTILPDLDENSWSPQEVRIRQAWQYDGGLPRPLCNMPVFDRRGNHLGTPDLLDEQAGVAVDYDGSLHLAGSRRLADLKRENRFRKAGLEYVTVVAGDRAQLGDLLDRFHSARDRARFAAPATRSWTTELPAWWVPTFTVDQRRELEGDQRSIWMRLRRTA